MCSQLICVQELQLKELDNLLNAYKHLAAASQGPYLQQQQTALADAKTAHPGRFCHYTSGSLTPADVKVLLSEYQQQLQITLRIH